VVVPTCVCLYHCEMKLVLLLLVLTIGHTFASSKSEKCATVSQEDCENMTSEYEKYRACMERRTKRSVDCDDEDENSCDNCDCNTCSYKSCDTCDNNNNNCCGECCRRSSCSTYNCCHQTCRAECKSNACKTSCRRRCQDKPTVVESQSLIGGKTESHHNITTVIHLNNVINNTNLINLPISVNNTVLNNITSQGRYVGSFRGEIRDGSNENCCLTIGPRQCVPQKEFPFVRCFHIRRKACGYVCSAPVVHYQRHEICDNNVNVQQPCRQQTIYVPQPQPRCAYHQNWPYVACGNQQFQNCEGCYSHYIKRQDATRCSNFCYDDGYGAGPYYRQGPFYRPGFAHAPSCYQTGFCNAFDGYGYNMGLGGGPQPGFPFMYPPQTYPFVIEDSGNSTNNFVQWDGPNSQESVLYPNLNNPAPVLWSNVPDKMMNIQAKVEPLRSERYAEIRIKTAKHNKVDATNRSTEKPSTTTPA
jgi:hypothetical protein